YSSFVCIMTFLNPAVLLGLVAAAIPIVLHFFNLRKLRVVDFSTLSFLKELQKTLIRRLKLTQILLLILRVIIIVCTVLAFARPIVPTALPGLGSKAKSSVVIIVDNSFSMELADERGVRLKQAKDIALKIIESLTEGDEAALVLMANPDDRRFVELTRDMHQLRRAIQSIPIAYTTGKLESSLRLAASILAKSQNINQEVFVITDNQSNILSDDPGAQNDSIAVFTSTVAVFVVPVGLESQVIEHNISVDSLNILTKIFEPGKLVELEVQVRNSAMQDAQEVIVSLTMNNERVAQRTVNIPAGETRTVPIAARAPERRNAVHSTLVRCAVEVEGDVLDADNHRHFGFALPPEPRIAIIGSSEEAAFVTLALKSSNISSTISVLAPESFSSIALNEYDGIFLINIPRFSTSDVHRLQAYIQDGGGIMIFAGNHSDVENYNTVLLPALQLGQAVLSDYGTNIGVDAECTLVDEVHPLFSGVFKNTNRGKRNVIESLRCSRAVALKRENRIAGMALIELPNGVFLAEAKPGNGKVLYCAVPPTMGWSNFPVTGIFAPLIFRTAVYLTASAVPLSEVSVGEPVRIVIGGRLVKGTSLSVIDPTNAISMRQTIQTPTGMMLGFENGLQDPGVYAVSTGTEHQQGKIVHILAVNPPSSESRMLILTGEEMKAQLQRFVARSEQIRVISDYRKATIRELRASAGAELWQVFLIVALLAAVMETIVARRAIVHDE
ncbi:MAG: BatA and WFA domain-containing protein, partial [Bacteroidota bacterium]|nr:BatA domain-containing protein [Candidatus Kapabacteria bacterium]MDW8220555.1 BatA and WFA domain-containing protein [Bacteroidota bacterium]